MIKDENLLIFFYGIMTVAVFVVMVFFGGLFNSPHTLLFREVSFLISPYSLNDKVTISLYRIYNINLLIFSLILFIRMRNIFAKLGAFYLSMSAVMGILLIQFPMDPLGTARSFSGLAHIIMTLVTVFYMVVALDLFGYAFKKNKNLILLAKYSYEISIIILLAGFITGIFALLSMPGYVGLIQKLPIAAFLFWILLTSLWIIKSDRRVKYE